MNAATTHREHASFPVRRVFAMPRAATGDASSDAVRELGPGHRIRTPTHPTRGDYLSLRTEEIIFGLLFAIMAYKLWVNVRGIFRYWKFVRAPNAPELEIDPDDAFEEGDAEEESGRKQD